MTFGAMHSRWVTSSNRISSITTRIEHIFGSLKLVVNKSLDVSLGARYSFDQDGLRYLGGSINYHRQCWGVDLTVYNNLYPEGNEPDELGVFMSITLTGLGTLPRINLGQTTY